MNGRKRTRQRTPNRATLEFRWFKENRAELFAKYPWQHLVIRDGRVVNASPSFTSALTYALCHYELGEFIIHKCTPDDSYDTVPVLNPYVFQSGI